MKKILSVLLCLALLCVSNLGVAAFAEAPSTPEVGIIRIHDVTVGVNDESYPLNPALRIEAADLGNDVLLGGALETNGEELFPFSLRVSEEKMALVLSDLTRAYTIPIAEATKNLNLNGKDEASQELLDAVSSIKPEDINWESINENIAAKFAVTPSDIAEEYTLGEESRSGYPFTMEMECSELFGIYDEILGSVSEELRVAVMDVINEGMKDAEPEMHFETFADLGKAIEAEGTKLSLIMDGHVDAEDETRGDTEFWLRVAAEDSAEYEEQQIYHLYLYGEDHIEMVSSLGSEEDGFVCNMRLEEVAGTMDLSVEAGSEEDGMLQLTVYSDAEGNCTFNMTFSDNDGNAMDLNFDGKTEEDGSGDGALQFTATVDTVLLSANLSYTLDADKNGEVTVDTSLEDPDNDKLQRLALSFGVTLECVEPEDIIDRTKTAEATEFTEDNAMQLFNAVMNDVAKLMQEESVVALMDRCQTLFADDEAEVDDGSVYDENDVAVEPSSDTDASIDDLSFGEPKFNYLPEGLEFSGDPSVYASDSYESISYSLFDDESDRYISISFTRPGKETRSKQYTLGEEIAPSDAPVVTYTENDEYSWTSYQMIYEDGVQLEVDDFSDEKNPDEILEIIRGIER